MLLYSVAGLVTFFSTGLFAISQTIDCAPFKAILTDEETQSDKMLALQTNAENVRNETVVKIMEIERESHLKSESDT